MEVKTSFKVEEGTVQETLMMPLYGRVYCEEHFPNTFPNKAAKETAAKVDYDFSKVKSSELNMVTWGLRARMLQDAAKDYLTKHPKATIINLGCGLDLSFDEIDNVACRFINMDLPNVIEARERIVSCKAREMNFAGDLMDFSWMERIQDEPYGVNVSDGVYIICGGVLMYFHTEQMKRFFLALADALRSPAAGSALTGKISAVWKSQIKSYRKPVTGRRFISPSRIRALCSLPGAIAFKMLRNARFRHTSERAVRSRLSGKLFFPWGCGSGWSSSLTFRFRNDDVGVFLHGEIIAHPDWMAREIEAFMRR